MDGLLEEYPNSTVYWERTVAGDGGGFRICRKAWTTAGQLEANGHTLLTFAAKAGVPRRRLTGGKYVPLVLEELLDEAPVTWARSYGGPLLPPMMLREPITGLPRDIPEETGSASGRGGAKPEHGAEGRPPDSELLRELW